ncbi:MAG: histidine phosphatase family protein [Nocardioides sp.]
MARPGPERHPPRRRRPCPGARHRVRPRATAPTRLWASDLARARETADIIGGQLGLAVQTDPRLREYDVGERSGLTNAEFAARFPVEYAAWLAEDDSARVAGEETTEQVHDRVVPGLRDCLDALAPGGTGIVVLHGACLKVGLMGLLGWPWQLSHSLRGVENGAWSVLSEQPDKDGLRLTSYNEKAGRGPHGPDFATDGPVG